VSKTIATLHASEQSTRFLESIVGVIFLGTPHRGSTLASHGHRVARALGLQGNILPLLAVGSPHLSSLAGGFRMWSQDARATIYTFHEQRPTRYGLGRLSVELFVSGLLFFSAEVLEHLDACVLWRGVKGGGQVVGKQSSERVIVAVVRSTAGRRSYFPPSNRQCAGPPP
jgi:hypothetical protein